MQTGMLRPQKNFTQGLVKIQSLDFGNLRDNEAKLYRQKLLDSKKSEKPVSKMNEDLRKKKMKQDAHGGHGASDSGDKASFGQCTFNMANILMVSASHFCLI